MRLIDTEKVIKAVDKHTFETKDGLCLDDDITCILEEVPTIEERKKGKWIDYTDEGYVECPFCHSATNCDGNKDELHYCFSCGARMETELRNYENKGDDE